MLTGRQTWRTQQAHFCDIVAYMPLERNDEGEKGVNLYFSGSVLRTADHKQNYSATFLFKNK
jgi:hypothetical protein